MGGEIKGLLRYIYLTPLLFITITPLPSSGSSPQELLQVGTGAFNDGFFQVAEAQFREFLQTYPQHAHAPKVKYLLGKVLYEQKKFVEAKDVFIQLLTSEEDFKGKDAAYFWVARSCMALNDLSCVKSNLLTIISKYPQDPWYLSSLSLLGKIFFKEGNYKRSEAYLREALKNREIAPPLSWHVKFWLGLSLYKQGGYKEAEALFQAVVSSALKEDPLQEAHYWLGETQIKLEKYKMGAETFRSFLKRFPHSPLTPNALYGESWALYKLGRREEGLRVLVALKKGFPHTSLLPKVLFLMGEIHIGLERYQEAVEILKDFLSRFPQNRLRGQSLLNLGWCYLKLGNLTQVKEVAYEIVKLPPGEREKALAQYILAELNTYEEKCQEAMPYWFNLLNTTSYRQDALFKIAMCFFREGKFKESLVNLDLLQLEYPDFSKMDEALWMKGESFRELGKLSEASEAYQRVIKKYKSSPWYPWCVYRIMVILLDKGDLDGGERWFETLYSEFPYHKLSYDAALKLGISKAERVEYKSSLRYLDIAAHSPDKRVVQNALCWQGEIYFNLKEYQKALDRFQRAVADSPPPGDSLAAAAYLEIGNIKHLLGDQEGAKKAYEKAIEVSGDEKFTEKVRKLLKESKGAKEEGA